MLLSFHASGKHKVPEFAQSNCFYFLLDSVIHKLRTIKSIHFANFHMVYLNVLQNGVGSCNRPGNWNFEHLSLMSSVILGKLLCHSETQFPLNNNPPFLPARRKDCVCTKGQAL